MSEVDFINNWLEKMFEEGEKFIMLDRSKLMH
jgi:hypothetical protein